ncbi:DUF402 domain-containing protein [Actinopolymorpha pittospori]|uniref:RNA-binding protein associated with RNAse of E/G family n=1 Tax=Actinopolymorpha pittospori TaxID=648752 RepID=A0A927RAK7_9ACTN|nr:DUF402 domain-containing protein [Actinopolymorpha pittospori]MBE1609107.1 putative RNA-binding protein associated with RNAse of E/G family [Actinopolymorpha pittospori]
MLALARWPGVQGLVATESLHLADTSSRAEALTALASGRWELGKRTWQGTTTLNLMLPGSYFSVILFFRDNDFARWYVNFERPYRRTEIGIDTLDLLLDLVIDPDLSFRWKDEDEYRQGRRLGIITDAEHHRVKQARDQVIALFEQRTGPFAEHWQSWRRSAEWPTPTLPTNVMDVPVTTE